MKKVMLILMVVFLVSPCSAWWGGEKQEPKQTIQAGEVWQAKFGGDERLIFDVTDKYVIYGYKNKGDIDFPSITTKERFLERFELVKAVEEYLSGSITITTKGELSYACEIITPKPEKPYLYNNPNNDHWICSKHGDLEPNSNTLYLAATVTFYSDTIYCYKCFGETFDKLFSEYMVGVENE